MGAFKARHGRDYTWPLAPLIAPMKSKPSACGHSKAPDDPGDGVKTLTMLAREAGVSPSTVLRILNGTAVVSAD